MVITILIKWNKMFSSTSLSSSVRDYSLTNRLDLSTPPIYVLYFSMAVDMGTGRHLCWSSPFISQCQYRVQGMQLSVLCPGYAVVSTVSRVCSCQYCVQGMQLSVLCPGYAVVSTVSRVCSCQYCVQGMRLSVLCPGYAAVSTVFRVCNCQYVMSHTCCPSTQCRLLESPGGGYSASQNACLNCPMPLSVSSLPSGAHSVGPHCPCSRNTTIHEIR
jgi:hypothetical protein